VTRYAAVFGAIALASAEVTAGLLLGLPLVVLFLALLVRLLAFPAYLVGGRSITGALRRSWASTAGHAWPLAGVVVLVGFANHALSSLPLVGPVGSALAAALQVGVVAAFVRRVR
jgi:membrane-anchored glycerophosphoryl diester phosphodiesterase (GDPDase)